MTFDRDDFLSGADDYLKARKECHDFEVREHPRNTEPCGCDGRGQIHHGHGALHYVTLCRDRECIERREREWDTA